MTVSLLRDLTRIVGDRALLTEAGDLIAYASDHKAVGLPPLCVALPTETRQVPEIVRACAARHTALIPRGAGTGTVGGAVPEAPAVVLDLSRLNRLLAVDRDNLLADAEAGMITGDFQRAMEAQDLFFPPDPASRDISTLGGNAATNAGGMRAVKYGVTADWIAALEVVLADGQTIRAGVRTRKGVVGYDLKHLFIGSEGTLGVITALTLRLIPKPPARQTVLGLFPELAAAGRALIAILGSGVAPAAMELMDAVALDAVRTRIGDLIPPGHTTLLIDVDGEADRVARDAESIGRLLRGGGADEVRQAADKHEADRLWSARRAISPALYEIRPSKISEDVTVPISRLIELFEGVTRLAREHRLPHACYGHAGDGNVHVNLLFDPQNGDEAQRARLAREAVFRLTLSLGGTLSGEHGVGLTKRAFVPWEQDAALIDLQRRLKRTFDPLNILNPGKVFP